jgi:hypothetical protein
METEMESQLRGVSSGQPQLFAEIAQFHDLRALPEQPFHIQGRKKRRQKMKVPNLSPSRQPFPIH